MNYVYMKSPQNSVATSEQKTNYRPGPATTEGHAKVEGKVVKRLFLINIFRGWVCSVDRNTNVMFIYGESAELKEQQENLKRASVKFQNKNKIDDFKVCPNFSPFVPLWTYSHIIFSFFLFEMKYFCTFVKLNNQNIQKSVE